MGLCGSKSFCLNSLKGLQRRFYSRGVLWSYKGDTRSLYYSPNGFESSSFVFEFVKDEPEGDPLARLAAALELQLDCSLLWNPW